MSGNTLDPDIAYFNAHIEELRERARAAGRDAVLIHNREVVDFFATVVEAGTEGYRKFGDGFLARSVSPERQKPVLASIFSA